MPVAPPRHQASDRRDTKRRCDEYRGTAHERGYDARWRKARVAYLMHNPLCVTCLASGTVTPATVVDHVIPHRGDMAAFWNCDNWQALCKGCHDVKTGKGE